MPCEQLYSVDCKLKTEIVCSSGSFFFFIVCFVLFVPQKFMNFLSLISLFLENSMTFRFRKNLTKYVRQQMAYKIIGLSSETKVLP